MTSQQTSLPTVAIAAVPAMLADTLEVLVSDAARVMVLVEDSCDHFDVLVTTEGAPRAPAHLVIELDASRDSRGGGLLRRPPTSTDPEELADLDAVLTVIKAVGTTGGAGSVEG